jgi:hypothetical protein
MGYFLGKTKIMNRVIVIILILFYIICIFADDQELPDVEISGPSELSTYSSKKGLLTKELMIPDVIDSIQSLVPNVSDKISDSAKRKKRAFYFDINNKLNFHTFLINDSILSRPLTFYANASSYCRDKYWADLSAGIGLQYLHKSGQSSITVKTIRTDTPFNLNMQTIDVIKASYRIDNLKLFNKLSNFNISSEIQMAKNGKNIVVENRRKSYFYNQMNLGLNFSSKQIMKIKSGLFHKTPLLSIETACVGNDGKHLIDIIRGISLNLNNKRVVPSINISGDLKINKYNTFWFKQQSDYKVYDNYSLQSEVPWQELQNDALISFTPINSHFIWSNSSLSSPDMAFTISGDLGLCYSIDKPVFNLSESEDLLPKAFAQNALINDFTISGILGRGYIQLSQSVRVSKGVLFNKTNDELPYEPLLTLGTNFEYKIRDLNFQTWVKQYYNTNDELGRNLRDSFDIGFQASYQLMQNLSFYWKASNLLNKGKFVFRTLPTEPASISMGFFLSF